MSTALQIAGGAGLIVCVVAGWPTVRYWDRPTPGPSPAALPLLVLWYLACMASLVCLTLSGHR